MFVSAFVFVLVRVLAPWKLESQAVVNCPTRVLGTEFESSARKVHAFNH